jgi:hypothetical protein
MILIHLFFFKFWGPGNHQLFVLSNGKKQDEQVESTKLFTIPFVKSALTSYLHSVRYIFSFDLIE